MRATDFARAPPELLQMTLYVSVPATAGVTVAMPLTAREPDQAPPATQLVAPDEDQVRVTCPVKAIEGAELESETVGSGVSYSTAPISTTALPELRARIRVAA